MLRTEQRTWRMPPGPAPASRSRGTWVLLAGLATAAVAIAAYGAELLTHTVPELLTWFDLRVYMAAGHVAQQTPAGLYTQQMLPKFWYTYTPFAALVFAALVAVPWGVLAWASVGLSVAALGLASWLTLGALGWRGRRRLGWALLIGGVALWAEPVTRTIRLGQIDLLLMALMIADLCQRDRQWWKGAGIGLAAGIKLVPLIFIPYLLLTRRIRQAVMALGVFLATAGLGFTALPAASSQWWFGPDFLKAARTGFVGFLANQSLRGLFTRASGAVWAGMWWWLDAAVLAAGLGLWAAVRLHQAGRPVEGWLTCALTGLLVSPVSWDHHWVWIVPALAVTVSAAARAGRWARLAWWSLTLALAGLFGAWPNLWTPHQPLVPWGLIWYAPGSPGGQGPHPWDSEYHWHGLAWLAGNLYVVAGVLSLAGLALAARRATAPATAAASGGTGREFPTAEMTVPLARPEVWAGTAPGHTASHPGPAASHPGPAAEGRGRRGRRRGGRRSRADRSHRRRGSPASRAARERLSAREHPQPPLLPPIG